MGKGIHKSAVVPLESAMLSLALVLTILRLVFRLAIQRSSLTLSDWFLVASAVNGIALLTTDVMAYKMGGMDDWDPDAPAAPESEQIALMKVSFAGNYFYDSGIYLPKLALLAFYYRMIPPTMPTLRKVLHAATGLTCSFMMTTVMVDTFWCGANVPVNWTIDGECSSFESMTITQIDWAMNITADLMVFLIPFPLLKGLQVDRKYMIGLIATFSTGLITVGASVARFVTMQVITSAWTNVYVLSMAEFAAAIIVVCIPALKSLVHRGMQMTTSKRSQERSGGSHSNFSKRYGAMSNHIKLSSKDPYQVTTRATASNGDESGSEVELTQMPRSGVIYKSERVSVTFEDRRDK